MIRRDNMWKSLVFLILAPQLSSASCGVGVQPSLTDKIVGGRDAGEGEFPWQASLLRKTSSGLYHTCGCSLITPTWLVTGAHCIRKNLTDFYRVMIGTNNLTQVTPDEIYSISKIVIKEGFSTKTFNNDIALIELFRSVPDMLSPICLTEEAPEADSDAVVTGWGATSEGGKGSPYLQAAVVRIIQREDCLQYYDLTESMTCAGYKEGGIDACQGDSGGPLLQMRNGTAFLVGTVSWGAGCAEPDQPGVYTDVPQFVQWIKHYLESDDAIIT